jgi:hypothetical protein
MICENINELKEKLKLENTKSVCIIDNNLMNFIVELKKQIDISYMNYFIQNCLMIRIMLLQYYL